MSNTSRFTTKKLVGIAALTAIVIILQLVGSSIRFGVFSISLVLIPIVVGAALYGLAGGAWLGLVFGTVVLLSGDAGPFLAVNPPGTIVTVLVKGVAAGLAAGLAYKLLEEKNQYLAIVIAAMVCPVVNTGIFLICCKIFFMPTINEWAKGAGFHSAGTYMILGLAGVNFLLELAVNVVLSPVIMRIIAIGQKENRR